MLIIAGFIYLSEGADLDVIYPLLRQEASSETSTIIVRVKQLPRSADIEVERLEYSKPDQKETKNH